MPVHYGDGTEYGDADAYYGRISNGLALAQNTQVRETGLKVSVIDERVNRWTELAGTDQNPRKFSGNPALHDPKVITYWSYRGQSDVCVLDNGDIVRVRVNIDTLDIEWQTITDGTEASQWETWSTLYSGPYYSVACAPDGNNVIVYGSKVDGVYRNNSKVWSVENIMAMQLHRNSDNRQVPDKIWLTQVGTGIDHPVTGLPLRKIDAYYSDDITSDTPEEVVWNLSWYRHQLGSIDLPNDKILNWATFPLYSPLAVNSGESILVRTVDSGPASSYKPWRLVRGVPGWGHNTVSGADIFKLSDGFYYMFYVEVHTGEDFDFDSNLKTPLVWQRSKDGISWSEPVHAGFNFWWFAGCVEQGDYVYIMGNGRVFQRPNTKVEYDITNYVPELSWESPRDNQSGSGSLTVANSEGVNDFLIDLSDRRIVIQPGIKVGADYEYAALDDFWVSKFRRTEDGKINRITGEFGNIWNRLENPIRDVLNFIGKTDYQDFMPDKPNEPFNYYFDGGEGSMGTAVDHEHEMTVTGGTCLWTGWKGLNPFFHIKFSSTDDTILYARYKDENNHIRMEYDGDTATVYSVKDGTATSLGSSSIGSGSCLGLRLRYKSIDVYKGKVLQFTVTDDTPEIVEPGYVGWKRSSSYTVTDFDFEDLEFNYTSADLIRQALAMGDYHDVKIGSAEAKQYALIWGPQTDIPTPADGLRQMLEAEKLELVWRDGFIEVGKFTDTSSVKTIENRIINTEYVQSGNRRINLANIDGNEDTWFEVDAQDAIQRDRMIYAYFDLPELVEEEAVRQRAIEEIRRGKLADAPGGTVPLFFDLWRMDVVDWVDNAGNSKLVRIEGMKVTINQSTQPSQRQELDTSLVEDVGS